MPRTVRVPSWLVSSVVFAPRGEVIAAAEAEKETRRVKFFRGGERWRPSVAVLDLVLAFVRIQSWTTRPDHWLPNSWRSIAAAMVPSMDTIEEPPPLPGGFHAKYSAALAELRDLQIAVLQADGTWTEPEALVDIRTTDWGGTHVVKGQRIWLVQFGRKFENAINAHSAAALNLSSYFALRGAHRRLAFVLGTAAAAHQNIDAKSPAIRTSSFFLPACGYAKTSWSFGAWEYRLCLSIADAIRGGMLANGRRLQVAVCADTITKSGPGRSFVERVHFRFWTDPPDRGIVRENISPTEARMRKLVGDDEVMRRLRGEKLNEEELELVTRLYFQAGRAGPKVAADRPNWCLMARLFGERRADLSLLLKLVLEEADTSPTSDHRPDLAHRDLVRIAVYRVRKRLFDLANVKPRG